MEILGVDFSGARPDNNTWVAHGELDGLGLTLRRCEPTGRSRLCRLLEAMPGDAVASLDFPFSVPLDFARFWAPDAGAMPDLWAAAAAMTLEEFMALRDDFVARKGEPKRHCDTLHPESYSCLHKVNPNMVPMTFYGMQMLSRLWPAGCDVPPLKPQQRDKVVLLEAMPGAALRAMGLPFKGYKNGARAAELRQQILDGLAGLSSVSVSNLEQFRDQCLVSHDCLDAVVAAVTAALWSIDPALFRRPVPADSGGPEPAVGIEGWLYAPVFLPGAHGC